MKMNRCLNNETSDDDEEMITLVVDKQKVINCFFFCTGAADDSTLSLMTNRENGHWLCGVGPYRWDNLQQQTKRSFHPHMAASMCKSGGDINNQQQKRSVSLLL